VQGSLRTAQADGVVSFLLKYSPSTARTVSGIESSFRAFRSCSSAFTISSDMATIILFIAKLDTVHTDTFRVTSNPRHLRGFV
jgi:hypothetical protein